MPDNGKHDDEKGTNADPDEVTRLLREFKRRDLVPEEIATEIEVDIDRGDPERALRRITEKRKELRRRGELDDDQDD